jgi:hypothetical protein
MTPFVRDTLDLLAAQQHDQPPPGHAEGADGEFVYDPQCRECRQVTAQAPPTAKASAGGGS